MIRRDWEKVGGWHSLHSVLLVVAQRERETPPVTAEHDEQREEQNLSRAILPSGPLPGGAMTRMPSVETGQKAREATSG